jgi:hypothetical protein
MTNDANVPSIMVLNANFIFDSEQARYCANAD